MYLLLLMCSIIFYNLVSYFIIAYLFILIIFIIDLIIDLIFGYLKSIFHLHVDLFKYKFIFKDCSFLIRKFSKNKIYLLLY
jgi:hypothetical protein